jgi:hypothetical protein
MRKAFIPLMVNRFISFSKVKRNQYLAQLMNRYVFWFYYQPEIPFGLMYLLHDKSQQFERLNYIRMTSTNRKRQKYDDVVYDVIRKACNCEHLKKSEIDEYIQFLIERKPEELINIMFKAGFKKSDVSKLIPELKPHLKEIKEPKLTKKELKSIVNELKHTTSFQQPTTQTIQVNTDHLL